MRQAQHTLDGGRAGDLALGAPRLGMTYSGTAPAGDRPTRVFAQLVDPERGVVVGNQVTPVPLVLDGSPQTLEVDLFDPGEGTQRQMIYAGVTTAAISSYAQAVGRGDELVRLKIVLPKPSDPELEAFVKSWEAGRAHNPRETSR